MAGHADFGDCQLLGFCDSCDHEGSQIHPLLAFEWWSRSNRIAGSPTTERSIQINNALVPVGLLAQNGCPLGMNKVRRKATDWRLAEATKQS